MSRVLILSPHADDAEIGCGGFISRVVSEGGTVCVVLFTVSAINFIHLGRFVSVQERLAEWKDSLDMLGVSKHTVLSEGLDGKLNTSPQSEFVKALDEIQEEFMPTMVLIPLPSSHQDHRYCWEVGIATTRPSAAKHSPEIIAAYEYPSTNWGDGAEANASRGGMYINVSEHWDKKIAALRQYKTQMRESGHLLSTEGITALGKLRGLESGFKYAELFHTLKIRVA